MRRTAYGYGQMERHITLQGRIPMRITMRGVEELLQSSSFKKQPA
jgi:hypothetical protein